MTWKKKRRESMLVSGPAWWSPGIYGPLHLDPKEDTADPQVNVDHVPLSDAQFGAGPSPVGGHVDAGDAGPGV